MKKALSAGSLIVLLLLTLFCRERAIPSSQSSAGNNAGPDTQADVAAIKALIEEWVRLYNAVDFDRLMAVFYTEGIVVMPPGVPAIKGKDAVLQMYREDDEMNIELVETSIVEDVRIAGDLAVARGRDTGTTTARQGGKPVPYDLKWVMAFERQGDGAWKCFVEIWCLNTPPTAPERIRPD